MSDIDALIARWNERKRDWHEPLMAELAYALEAMRAETERHRTDVAYETYAEMRDAADEAEAARRAAETRAERLEAGLRYAWEWADAGSDNHAGLWYVTRCVLDEDITLDEIAKLRQDIAEWRTADTGEDG